jgi:plasmid maintenance system antidote protein VapI
MDDRVVRELARIGELLMDLKTALTELITKLKVATDNVAAEIDKLRKAIAALLANPNAITPEDAAAIEAGLQTQIDLLSAMGKDPDKPLG